MRIALLTVLLLLLGAAPAAAAELTLFTAPRDGAILGEDSRFAGTLTQDGKPLAGQAVTLEARRHPFDGPFEFLDTITTDKDGAFRFVKRLDRNTDVRVSALAVGATSPTLRAYVFPRARLGVRTVRRNVVRMTQTMIVPRDVRLRAPSRFYLGRARAKSAAYVASAPPRRIRAGRYVARLDVRIPKAYKGRFSFAACFRATAGSGLGDPKATCPRSKYRF
jgi:hypothetical protein